MSVLTTENDPRVGELRTQLDAYYGSATDYVAFKEVSKDLVFWNPVARRVGKILEQKGSCEILEMGAGMTGFSAALGEDRSRVSFAVQDVTNQNREHLQSVADTVYIGDISNIDDQFDVIFSTFVFEHVTTPSATLKKKLELLNPGGSLFITCPRYGFPLYIPPSARHYGLTKRVKVMSSFLTRRIRSMISGRPAFVIHTAPAILENPYFVDADAIHWPCIRDLRQSLPGGYSMRKVEVPFTGLRGRIYKSLMLLNVEIRRES